LPIPVPAPVTSARKPLSESDSIAIGQDYRLSP